MIGDVRNLLRVQPRVDGVQYRAHTGDTVIRFEVPVTVPRQRRDPVAHPDAAVRQSIRKLARAPVAFPIVVSMNIALDAAGNDFSIAVITVSVADQ